MTLVGASVAPQPVVAQKRGFHITGTLDATDQEAQEGYFGCGRDLQVVARPDTPIHDDLKAMVGRTVQISIFEP